MSKQKEKKQRQTYWERQTHRRGGRDTAWYVLPLPKSSSAESGFSPQPVCILVVWRQASLHRLLAVLPLLLS